MPLPRSSTVSAGRLLELHRYHDALAKCDEELRRNGLDASALYARAAALLCLGRLSEALEAFIKANDIRSLEVPRSQPHVTWIGTVQWLLEAREDAIRTFRRAVDGVLDGSVQYTDSAGGVDQGLLLYYAGVTIKSETVRNHAITYLKHLSEKPWIAVYPGALALFVLDAISLDELLEQATKERHFISGLPELPGRRDLVKRQRLCDALFYIAVRRRAEGDERGCLEEMRRCAAIENPVWTKEWYLARADLKSLTPDSRHMRRKKVGSE